MYNNYNKLVRDSVPLIIKENGATPDISQLSDEEFSQELLDVLEKRIKELREGYSLEAIADTVELLDAFCALRGVSIEDVMYTKEKMRLSRGGYEKRIFLKGYID